MLTAAELASMRATAAAALPGTCSVQRSTRTPDGMGGYSDDFDEVASVACRIAPLGSGGQEAIIAQKLEGVSLCRVIVPQGTDVQESDRLLADGRLFEVVGTLARTWESALVCIGAEVD